MAASAITLSFPEEDVALISLDTPGKGANILSAAMLDELDATLIEVEQKAGLAGLVIASGKPGMFIAGADLREFAASLDIPGEQVFEMCRRGQNLFRRLSQCSFVTVAAIDGICVGGGAELAVWCDRRIMSQHPKAEFGFPEVKLGLFPGWGGTVRAPRIAGLGNAVEMITGGDSIGAADAYKNGLVSDVVPSDDLLPASIRLIRDEQQSEQYKQDRQTWAQPISMSETELTFLGLTASAMIKQTTKGQYPAPEAALETMLEGSMLGLAIGTIVLGDALIVGGIIGVTRVRTELTVRHGSFHQDRYLGPIRAFSTKLDLRKVERVRVQTRDPVTQGCVLVCDDETLRIGRGLEKPALEWLRDWTQSRLP